MAFVFIFTAREDFLMAAIDQICVCYASDQSILRPLFTVRENTLEAM